MFWIETPACLFGIRLNIENKLDYITEKNLSIDLKKLDWI